MQPPAFDSRGKNQNHPAVRPTEEPDVDDHGDVTLVDARTVSASGDIHADRDPTLARRLSRSTKLLPKGTPPPTPPPTPKGTRPRPDATADSAVRARQRLRTQQALALYAEGWSTNDIAAHLEVASATVIGDIARHRRAVTIADIDQDLDRIALPLAKENLIHGLLAGDKDYTLKTLEGRGRFRRHTEDQTQVVHELPALVIRFETPIAHPDVPTATAQTGAIGTVVGSRRLPPADIVTTPVRVEPGERVDTALAVGVPSRPKE